MSFNNKNNLPRVLFSLRTFFVFQELTEHEYHSNWHVSTNTCGLGLLAHIVNVAVQPVESAHQACNSFLAELHAVLEMQSEFLLTAVL